MKRLLLTLCLGFFCFVLHAQDPLTLTYAKLPDEDLALDLYLPPNTDKIPKPLVIFVHGGGFSGGNRSGGETLGRYLSKRGIAVASISYTLYMKNRTKDWSCDGILPEKIKAIQLAANQTWLATSFLLEKASTYRFNPEQIFIAGSSAGGETVLHAAFWDRDQMQMIQHDLPEDFKYAGIISGAGAIMDLNLITAENAIPTMVFHGDSDKIVPYGTAAHHYCPPNSSGWLMLFGSRSIADHLAELGTNYMISSFVGGGHGYAGHYFRKDIDLIDSFIGLVTKGSSFKMEMTVD
jgi:predicted esterase